MGAPPEVLAEAEAAMLPAQFEIFEENWQAAEIFLDLSSQWNIVNGVYIGLLYQSVDILLTMYEVENRREVFEQIQIMEFSALKSLKNRE